MKLRLRWLVLAVIGFGSQAQVRAQDRELTAAEREELDATKAKGVVPRWHVDFWPAWPSPTDNFADVYLSGATDPLELGYYLDERSISPKHFYGVIVPRFGVVWEGRNFLVEVNSRRVVGVLDGPGFAFPKAANAAWSYHWAPDGASFIFEQADERQKVWGRRVLQLVELRGGLIAKQTDLLKQPGKTPSWFDAKGLPGKEHSSPPAPGAALRLAETSSDVNDWSVRREANGGPLQMMKGGVPVATLPAVGGLVAEAKGGELRTMSSDEAPGLPLCFFSPDGKWLFVNQITRVDALTGGHWRSGALYHRTDATDGKAAPWELAVPEALDERAWQAFAKAAGVPVESIAPPDTSGFRNRTMEFVAWNQKTGYHALVYLRARNGVSPPDHPSFYRWYCYLNTKTLEFEQDLQLQSANEELRKHWNSGDETLSAPHVQLRATGEQGGLFAPPSEMASFADDSLNSAYQALLMRASKEQAEKTRAEQREWLADRETIAWVHTLQRWTRFTDAVLVEGRFLATHLRAEELSKEAIDAHAGPNSVVRDKSPDGKFAILYTYDPTDLKQDGRPAGVELIALPTKKVVLDLYDDTENQSLAASWAPDSQHLAFHQASRRIAETLIYERRGDQFVALKMPSMDPYEPKTRKDERQGHFNYADLAVKRWLGAKSLLAHHGIEFDVQGNDGNGETRTVSADYDLVLTIEKGKVIVEKATKTRPQN